MRERKPTLWSRSHLCPHRLPFQFQTQIQIQIQTQTQIQTQRHQSAFQIRLAQIRLAQLPRQTPLATNPTSRILHIRTFWFRHSPACRRHPPSGSGFAASGGCIGTCDGGDCSTRAPTACTPTRWAGIAAQTWMRTSLSGGAGTGTSSGGASSTRTRTRMLATPQCRRRRAGRQGLLCTVLFSSRQDLRPHLRRIFPPALGSVPRTGPGFLSHPTLMLASLRLQVPLPNSALHLRCCRHGIERGQVVGVTSRILTWMSMTGMAWMSCSRESTGWGSWKRIQSLGTTLGARRAWKVTRTRRARTNMVLQILRCQGS